MCPPREARGVVLGLYDGAVECDGLSRRNNVGWLTVSDFFSVNAARCQKDSLVYLYLLCFHTRYFLGGCTRMNDSG